MRYGFREGDQWYVAHRRLWEINDERGRRKGFLVRTNNLSSFLVEPAGGVLFNKNRHYACFFIMGF